MDWQRIRGRGVDHLIDEYLTTHHDARKLEIERLLHCYAPVDEPPAPGWWDIRIATMDDLRLDGRIQPLFSGSDAVHTYAGVKVPDLPMDIINLQESFICGDQTVVTNGNLALVEAIRHNGPLWIFDNATDGYLINIDAERGIARFRAPEGEIRLPEGRVYFMFHGYIGSANFAHFLIDILPQVAAFDKLKVTYGDALVPLFAHGWPGFIYPQMPWLFESLFANSRDIVHVKGRAKVWVERAFTTSKSAVGEGGLCFEAVRYARKRLVERLSPTPGATHPRRVYVSRKDVGDREVANIQEIEVLLESYGFTTILAANLTPQQAFDAFYGAEVIVGMHGTGLMYHCYAKGPTAVIELASQMTWRIILAYADAIGHTPYRIDRIGEGADIRSLKLLLSQLCSISDPVGTMAS